MSFEKRNKSPEMVSGDKNNKIQGKENKMKKYVITNISAKYEKATEVFFTRNGRKYLLVTDALWDPLDRGDILPDGYNLYIEGDEEDEWLLLDEKSSGVDYCYFNSAIVTYCKQQEELGKEPDYVH